MPCFDRPVVAHMSNQMGRGTPRAVTGTYVDSDWSRHIGGDSTSIQRPLGVH